MDETRINQLGVELYADGADIDQMVDAYKSGLVTGFTTNPSLMKAAGVTDYIEFAHQAVASIPDLPISFEVFSDDFDDMEEEAHIISHFGTHVYVKIPVMNSLGESSIPLIHKLSHDGIKVNATAIFTEEQVRHVRDALDETTGGIVSVFAGRIADTGVDPRPLMSKYADIVHFKPNLKLLWASQREVYNIMQAAQTHTDIITCTPDSLKKLTLLGKPLAEYSLDTVKRFKADSQALGFKILTK
ncbi:MAG: transaldolase [Furfurilactobacillus sp.]|jgi:transaldolase|uniref:Transaldolase n=1 Tax=Furfurilactobacillus milii TaxID=2888272 RepID=A0ABT6D7K8_9LACO|nr:MULTISPECIES: transaldolase [Furfurilactobacillus]QLE66282.1 Transaldolase [Furfurilactobacillus rossiae]MCF6159738.1 transaldolase [Furfurilactobacillus milii]MCF6163177.1 transaldolase [Furfurilactobacillus milii]MCF6419119.1 transaldolase [Furfurilactobacillus milii]MCH4011006.1 transaldolase [Furfurilactobacillus sp.]